MRPRGFTILVSTLGAFCCVGVAFGQAPNQGLQHDEPLWRSTGERVGVYCGAACCQ